MIKNNIEQITFNGVIGENTEVKGDLAKKDLLLTLHITTLSHEELYNLLKIPHYQKDIINIPMNQEIVEDVINILNRKN